MIFETEKVFNKVREQEAHLDRIMNYRNVCTMNLNEKIGVINDVHGFAYDLDIDREVGRFIPFYSLDRIAAVKNIVKFSNDFIEKYGIDKRHVGGNLFSEYLLHLNPFLQRKSKGKELKNVKKKYVDHFIHQFYVYLIGYELLNNEKYLIKIDNKDISLKQFFREYIINEYTEKIKTWTDQTNKILPPEKLKKDVLTKRV